MLSRDGGPSSASALRGLRACNHTNGYSKNQANKTHGRGLQRFYIQTITYQIFALMVRQAHHERKYLIFITVRAELVEAHWYYPVLY
jgi:hypothetical protein